MRHLICSALFITLSLNALDNDKLKATTRALGFQKISLKQCLPTMIPSTSINVNDKEVPAGYQVSFTKPNELLFILTKLHRIESEYSGSPASADIFLINTDTLTSKQIAADHPWSFFPGYHRGTPELVYNKRRKKLFLIGNNLVSDLDDPRNSRRLLNNKKILGYSPREKKLIVLDKPYNEIKFLDIDTLDVDPSMTIPAAYHPDKIYDAIFGHLVLDDIGNGLTHNPKKKLIAYRSAQDAITLIRNYSKDDQVELPITVTRDCVTSIDFNGNGTLLLCSTYKGDFYIWDTQTAQLLHKNNLAIDKSSNTLKFVTNSIALNVSAVRDALSIKFNPKTNSVSYEKNPKYLSDLKATNKKGLIFCAQPIGEECIARYVP